MSKIELSDITSGYSVSKINENFQKIEDALNDEVLFRDNPDDEDNSVQTDIDLNNKRILNLPEPISSSEPVRKQDWDESVGAAEEARDEAIEAKESAEEAREGAETAKALTEQIVLDYSVNRTFDTLQDLLEESTLIEGLAVRTLGYLSEGDGGGNDYLLVPAGSGTHDDGSYIDLPVVDLQAKGLFPYGIRVEQFGVLSKGYPDSSEQISRTLAYESSVAPLKEIVQKAPAYINGYPDQVSVLDYLSLVETDGGSDTKFWNWSNAFQQGISDAQASQVAFDIPRAYYGAAEMITVDGIYNIIKGNGARIYGIAETAQNAILQFNDARQTKLLGGLLLYTDGNEASPVYHDNYGTALQITSTGDASQFMWFDGLQCHNIKSGLTFGNLFGEEAQAVKAQSEIYFNKFDTRGCMRPIYSNAIGGIVEFSSSNVIGQQFEASSSWWEDSSGWLIRADEGAIILNGGELQRAIASGWALYGDEITINNAVHEYSCKSQLKGSCEIRGVVNGYFSQANNLIQVDSGSEGRLVLEGYDMRRPSTVGADASLVVDCAEPDYEIEFRNSKLTNFQPDATSNTSYIVKGGRLILDDVTLDNNDIGGSKNTFGNKRLVDLGVDVTGYSVDSVDDAGDKGGFTNTSASSGAYYRKDTSDLPSNTSSTYFAHTDSTGLTLETPVFNLPQEKDLMLSVKVKTTATGGYLRAYVTWQNFEGVDISTVIYIDKTGEALDSEGFSSSWKSLNSFLTVPSGACKAKVGLLFGGAADMLFTDLKLAY